MFKIWDKVRIKSREQMEKEFGLDKNWDISNWFIYSMKDLCWRTAEISETSWDNIELINRNNDNEVFKWGYSTDMIELIEENKTQQERTPTQWEYVEVSNDNTIWNKRIFIINLWWRYHCATVWNESECKRNETYEVSQWDYIRQIKKQTYTIEATEEQYKKIQELIA